MKKQFESLFFPRLAIFEKGAPTPAPESQEHTAEEHEAERAAYEAVRNLTPGQVMDSLDAGVKSLATEGVIYEPNVDKAKGTITFKANGQEFKVQLVFDEHGISAVTVDNSVEIRPFDPKDILKTLKTYTQLANGKDAILATLSESGFKDLKLVDLAGHPEILFSIDDESHGSFVFPTSNPGQQSRVGIAVSMSGSGYSTMVRAEDPKTALQDSLVKAMNMASLIEIKDELADVGKLDGRIVDGEYVECEIGKGKTLQVQKRRRATDSGISYEVYEGGHTDLTKSVKGPTLRASVDEMLADLKVDHMEE